MEFLDKLVESYPGAFVLLTLFLIGVVAYMGTTLKWFVKREFKRMEAHEAAQDKAIKKVEERLTGYDITFAVSKTSFDDLCRKIDGHIKKEDELPVLVAKIVTDVAWIKSEIQRQNGKKQS
jgi:Na+-transporting methylmalonyl-CoA/oxaloacetate decarboxylase gamma subunit